MTDNKYAAVDKWMADLSSKSTFNAVAVKGLAPISKEAEKEYDTFAKIDLSIGM